MHTRCTSTHCIQHALASLLFGRFWLRPPCAREHKAPSSTATASYTGLSADPARRCGRVCPNAPVLVAPPRACVCAKREWATRPAALGGSSSSSSSRPSMASFRPRSRCACWIGAVWCGGRRGGKGAWGASVSAPCARHTPASPNALPCSIDRARHTPTTNEQYEPPTHFAGYNNGQFYGGGPPPPPPPHFPPPSPYVSVARVCVFSARTSRSCLCAHTQPAR